MNTGSGKRKGGRGGSIGKGDRGSSKGYSANASVNNNNTRTPDREEKRDVVKKESAADANVNGVYTNPRFTHSVAALIGVTMRVETQNRKIFEGILKTFSPNAEMVLEMVHRVDPENSDIIDCNTIEETVIFPITNVVRFYSTEVELDYAAKESFQTDAQIGKTSASGFSEEDRYRRLEVWQPDDDIEAKGIEDEYPASNGWDVNEMFAKNEEMGFKTSYDPNLSGYTVALNKEKMDSQEYRAREREAERIAAKIEASDRSRAQLELENDDEEEAYSAVVRPDRRSGHKDHGGDDRPYVPPARRENSRGLGGPGRGGSATPSGRNGHRGTPPGNRTTPPPANQATRYDRYNSSMDGKDHADGPHDSYRSYRISERENRDPRDRDMRDRDRDRDQRDRDPRDRDSRGSGYGGGGPRGYENRSYGGFKDDRGYGGSKQGRNSGHDLRGGNLSNNGREEMRRMEKVSPDVVSAPAGAGGPGPNAADKSGPPSGDRKRAGDYGKPPPQPLHEVDVGDPTGALPQREHSGRRKQDKVKDQKENLSELKEFHEKFNLKVPPGGGDSVDRPDHNSQLSPSVTPTVSLTKGHVVDGGHMQDSRPPQTHSRLSPKPVAITPTQVSPSGVAGAAGSNSPNSTASNTPTPSSAEASSGGGPGSTATTPATPSGVAPTTPINDTVKKSTLNPLAKEFTLNPTAKEFTPRSALPPAGRNQTVSNTPPRPQTPGTPVQGGIYGHQQYHVQGGGQMVFPQMPGGNYIPAVSANPPQQVQPQPMNGQRPMRPNSKEGGGGPHSNNMVSRPEPMQVQQVTGPPILAPGNIQPHYGIPPNIAAANQLVNAHYILGPSGQPASIVRMGLPPALIQPMVHMMPVSQAATGGPQHLENINQPIVTNNQYHTAGAPIPHHPQMWTNAMLPPQHPHQGGTGGQPTPSVSNNNNNNNNNPPPNTASGLPGGPPPGGHPPPGGQPPPPPPQSGQQTPAPSPVPQQQILGYPPTQGVFSQHMYFVGNNGTAAPAMGLHQIPSSSAAMGAATGQMIPGGQPVTSMPNMPHYQFIQQGPGQPGQMPIIHQQHQQ